MLIYADLSKLSNISLKLRVNTWISAENCRWRLFIQKVWRSVDLDTFAVACDIGQRSVVLLPGRRGLRFDFLFDQKKNQKQSGKYKRAKNVTSLTWFWRLNFKIKSLLSKRGGPLRCVVMLCLFWCNKLYVKRSCVDIAKCTFDAGSNRYSGVLIKWEFFIKMRAACFAPSFLQKRGVLEWGWLQVGSSHFNEKFSL